jgi:hypothetical protein
MALSSNGKNLPRHDSLDPFEIYDDLVFEATTVNHDDLSYKAPKKSVPTLTSPSKMAAKSEGTRDDIERGSGRSLKRGVSLLSNRRLSIGAVVILTCYLAYAVKPWSYFVQTDLVYAYFEVRAVDLDGRPIAGAVVKNSGQKVGTTDSFGEWRRYLRVPLGGTVPVTLTKKIKNQTHFVTKNFAIPPLKPEKSEIELRSSVQLLPTNKKDGIGEGAVDINRNEGMTTSIMQNLSLSLSSLDQSLKSRTDVEESIKRPMDASDESNDSADSKILSSNPDSVWFEVIGRKDNPLFQEVLPALVTRAKELGLRVEKKSKWVVQLKNLLDMPRKIAKDGGGLILVRSVDKMSQDNHANEFLRNYQNDSMSTARGILFGLMNHIKKDVMVIKVGDRWSAVMSQKDSDFWKISPRTKISNGTRSFSLSEAPYSHKSYTGFYLDKSSNEPCMEPQSTCVGRTLTFGEVPPVDHWVKLKLKGPSYNASGASVFVAGYRARRVGDNVFEYWGQDKTRSNVTVIKDDRVIIRGFVDNRYGELVFIGGRNLTRR